MRKIISTVNMLILHIWKNFIKTRATFLALSLQWTIASQSQFLSANFWMTCNCKFISQSPSTAWNRKTSFHSLWTICLNRFFATLRQKCSACRAILIEKIFQHLSSNNPEDTMNAELFFTTFKSIYNIHSKQLKKCLYNNNSGTFALLLPVDSIKSNLFHYLENHTTYEKRVKRILLTNI